MQINNPHRVPIELTGYGYYTGSDPLGPTPLSGTLDGWIWEYDAQRLPHKIRKLVTAILDKKIGTIFENTDMRKNRIHACGSDLWVLEGMEQLPQLFQGEMCVSMNATDSYFRELDIAHDGYSIPSVVRTHRMDIKSIFLDTRGQWILDAIQNGCGQKKEMVVTAVGQDQTILLSDASNRALPRYEREGMQYYGTFLLVSRPEEIHMEPLLQHQLAIVLEMYHTLRAVHITCIGPVDEDD